MDWIQEVADCPLFVVILMVESCILRVALKRFFPLELNIERVKRSRELGVLRLGQPLKSFRDHIGDFGIYQKGLKHDYLDSLDSLIKPERLDHLSKLKIQENLLEQISTGIDYKGGRNLEKITIYGFNSIKVKRDKKSKRKHHQLV